MTLQFAYFPQTKIKTNLYSQHDCIQGDMMIPSSQVASSGDGRNLQTVPDGSGSERPDPVPGWRKHGVLPHLRGLCLWLCARGGGRSDSGNLRQRPQLSSPPAQRCRGALHLPQGLERAAGHLREGEGDDADGEDRKENEAAGVVHWIPSADEG